MDPITQDEHGAFDTHIAPVRARRRMLRPLLLLLGPVVAILVAATVYLGGGRYETTDDAYVQIAKVAVSADVSGRVREVKVHDNQRVKKGDVLFLLDEAPFRIAVEEADARLAATRLKIESLKANYRQRQSEIASARDTLHFAKTEADRQERLSTSGIASQSQVDRATHAHDEARSQLSSARQQLSAVVASLAGDPEIEVNRHPEVMQAQAALDRAKLNLGYTVIKAPLDGVVTRVEELQVGSAINAQAPVFALVSTEDIWIEANFKEDQLAHMRAGQPVTVQVDTYHDRTLTGKVASVSPGTGSQFSVLPPENATGNWVKVVQRLPVRIELDRLEPGIALRSGMSADVSVDTGHQRRLPWNRTSPPNTADIAR